MVYTLATHCGGRFLEILTTIKTSFEIGKLNFYYYFVLMRFTNNMILCFSQLFNTNQNRHSLALHIFRMANNSKPTRRFA